MDKLYDVIALGELLVDFTSNGKNDYGNDLFEANPGGAPCNVLSMLSKLGKKTVFIGKVGNDMFGDYLCDAVKRAGIDSDYILRDKEINTTLAFVHTLEDGDREFSFYRNPGADMCISVNDIDESIIKKSRIFHFGTLSSTHDIPKKATRYALDIAKKNGLIISFDPNLREPLWNNLNDAKNEMDYGMNQCDILKISDNEIKFYTGENDYDEAVRIIRSKHGIKLILVTLGKYGSIAYYKNIKIEGKPYSHNRVIETTGAGDTFCALSLNYILNKDIDNLCADDIRCLLDDANAAASFVTTRKGALSVMPTREEIDRFKMEFDR